MHTSLETIGQCFFCPRKQEGRWKGFVPSSPVLQSTTTFTLIRLLKFVKFLSWHHFYSYFWETHSSKGYICLFFSCKIYLVCIFVLLWTLFFVFNNYCPFLSIPRVLIQHVPAAVAHRLLWASSRGCGLRPPSPVILTSALRAEHHPRSSLWTLVRETASAGPNKAAAMLLQGQSDASRGHTSFSEDITQWSPCHQRAAPGFHLVGLQLKAKLVLNPICTMMRILPFVLPNYVKFYDSGSLLNFVFTITQCWLPAS